MELHTGEVEPELGWYSPAYGVMEPTLTLVVSRRASDIAVTTLLRLQPTQSPPLLGRPRTTESEGSYVVSWAQGDEQFELVISKDLVSGVELIHQDAP